MVSPQLCSFIFHTPTTATAVFAVPPVQSPVYLEASAPAAIRVERQQRNQDPKCVAQTERAGAAGAAGCASLSRIRAGTAGKRQEVQAEEEQWGFSLTAANKTI